ncbi:hypothetical protein EAI6_18620 [Enterobacter asburiae]|nr:hypothetical protein EAI6_18620 [Enterobacter asburiae]
MFPLTPSLSLKGEGVVRAGIVLWGSLNPPEAGFLFPLSNLLLFLKFNKSDLAPND